jgi:hypothetical protein
MRVFFLANSKRLDETSLPERNQAPGPDARQAPCTPQNKSVAQTLCDAMPRP